MAQRGREVAEAPGRTQTDEQSSPSRVRPRRKDSHRPRSEGGARSGSTAEAAMKRTIADARIVLEQDLAPTMNDYAMRQARTVLEAAEQRARSYAEEYAAKLDEEVRSIRDETGRELAEVRDAMEDLAADGASETIPAEVRG